MKKSVAISDLLSSLSYCICSRIVNDPEISFSKVDFVRSGRMDADLILGTAKEFDEIGLSRMPLVAISVGESIILKELAEQTQGSFTVLFLNSAESIADILLIIHKLFESSALGDASINMSQFSDLMRDVVLGSPNHLMQNYNYYLSIKQWELNDIYYCLKVKADPKAKVQYQPVSLNHNLNEVISAYESIEIDGELYIIVNMTRSDISDRKDLELRFFPLLTKYGAIAASSNRFIDFRFFEACCKQTDLAFKLGSIINPTYKFQPFSFYNLYYLLEICSEHVDLNDFIHPIIKQLREYDKKNGTEYVPTLQAFFNSDRKIQKAADHLYIHKNTFMYRMDKIRNITGVDFTRDFRTVNYIISCSICKLLRCKEENTGEG